LLFAGRRLALGLSLWPVLRFEAFTTALPGASRTPSLTDQFEPHAQPFWTFRCFAFCRLAFAAAFDALIALSLRSFWSVNAFARACPPRRPYTLGEDGKLV